MTRATANAILRQIEALGYAVSVHHMREYVELPSGELLVTYTPPRPAPQPPKSKR